MKRVLISAPYFIPVIERYRARFAEAGIELVIADVKERLSEDDLLKHVGDIDGALCGDDAYTDRVMGAAPKLRVIAKWGTGIDSIDLDAAARRGIQVKNTPDAFTEPVADTVLGYMLCFSRRLPWMSQEMKQGRWEKIPGKALGECTLGIIGVGNIGKAVARRARAFGMRILGHDIRDSDPAWDTLALEMVSRDAVLQSSDFVSLNCDLRPGNHYMMSHQQFAMMKAGAVLINTARGPLVNEAALVASLESGHLGGVGLDVFEVEPLPHSSLLMTHEMALIAPHNSNSSPKAWERVHESTVSQLLSALSEVE